MVYFFFSPLLYVLPEARLVVLKCELGSKLYLLEGAVSSSSTVAAREGFDVGENGAGF